VAFSSAALLRSSSALFFAVSRTTRASSCIFFLYNVAASFSFLNSAFASFSSISVVVLIYSQALASLTF